MELFGIVLNCLELLKSYKWTGWMDGWMDWILLAEKPSPLRAPAVLTKKLVPLKHLVKLRKSCVQMILPDIRKCSNLVQNMVANRYSCFWGLGAIWQPLWLKNSHNMAIFHHFLTFSVTFLVAMTSFMHKTCTERTETFLIHRTIDEVPFLPFPGTYPGVQGSKKWLFYG